MATYYAPQSGVHTLLPVPVAAQQRDSQLLRRYMAMRRVGFGIDCAIWVVFGCGVMDWIRFHIGSDVKGVW